MLTTVVTVSLVSTLSSCHWSLWAAPSNSSPPKLAAKKTVATASDLWSKKYSITPTMCTAVLSFTVPPLHQHRTYLQSTLHSADVNLNCAVLTYIQAIIWLFKAGSVSSYFFTFALMMTGAFSQNISHSLLYQFLVGVREPSLQEPTEKPLKGYTSVSFPNPHNTILETQAWAHYSLIGSAVMMMIFIARVGLFMIS